MRQKDKDSLTVLLNDIRNHYKDFSRLIRWTETDSERLDDLGNSAELQKDLHRRIIRAGAPKSFIQYTVPFLIYKAWERTKAVYSFNQEFVSAMAQTDDTCLYLDLLNRLPFSDMLFFFPDGLSPKHKDGDTVGIYVHVESQADKIAIIFHYLERYYADKQIYPDIVIAFSISDGMKVSQVFDNLRDHNPWIAYRRLLNEQEADNRLLAEQKALNTAIFLLYYLSTAKPDLSEIKPHKKSRKSSSTLKEDNTPAVILQEVGAKYPEIVYRRFVKDPGAMDDSDIDDIDEEKTTSRIANNKQNRRPHVRRAHMNYYWIGKGRSTRISHWIPASFIGGKPDDNATVVYDVVDKNLKGKRNPNSSKKKRNK